MNPSLSPAPPAASVVRAEFAACAALRMTPAELPLLRRNPGAARREPLSPALLKHADPQTIAGLAAVLQALQGPRLRQHSFDGWGAIAGPSFLGRQASADSVQRFRDEGAFAISPHLVPHESLHSVSGTVSQALGLHGPNFGVGGSPGAAEEALLVAATLLADGVLPGLWVILTDFDPELIPLKAGEAPGESPWICYAVALALIPGGQDNARQIQIGVGSADPATPSDYEPLRLKDLAAAIAPGVGGARTWRFRNGGWITLTAWDRAEAECE